MRTHRRSRYRRAVIFLVVLMATSLFGGAHADEAVPVTGVSLDQATMSLTAGGSTGALTATVNPSDATNTNVTWTSSEESVATVSGGVVTPVAAGSTTITVTTSDGSFSTSCAVTVAEPVTPTGISLNKSELVFHLGDSAETLAATITPANATNKTVTWESQNTSVAAVTDGVVSPTGVGTTAIVATAVAGENVREYCMVTVTQPIAADGGGIIEINSDPVTITVPDTVTDASMRVTTTPGLELPLIEIYADTSLGRITMTIPGGVVEGPAGWDGSLTLPTVKTSPGAAVTGAQSVNATVEIGFGNETITFSDPVRILIPGMAGKSAGYIRNGVFTPITRTISADDKTTADTEIPAGSDGKMNVGSDLVIWTKHFTEFVAYTVASSGGGGGGGSSTTTYPVIIDSANGIVTANKTTAASGAKVTITVTPDDGYVLAELSVKDKKGNEISCTDNGDGTYTFTMPASKVTVTPAFEAEAIDIFPFTDVPETNWAREAVAWAYEKGLFSGTTATTFGPGVSTTRGMIVTVLWRQESTPAVEADNPFTDVAESAYFAASVAWASENKVINGYGNDLFGPKDTITREQMAAILYRYAADKSYDVSKTASLDSFPDAAAVSGYAKAAMEWAVGNGLISGRNDGSLAPKANATRAEVALILMRFSELYE